MLNHNNTNQIVQPKISTIFQFSYMKNKPNSMFGTKISAIQALIAYVDDSEEYLKIIDKKNKLVEFHHIVANFFQILQLFLDAFVHILEYDD